jgi:hypothetical protein
MKGQQLADGRGGVRNRMASAQVLGVEAHWGVLYSILSE